MKTLSHYELAIFLDKNNNPTLEEDIKIKDSIWDTVKFKIYSKFNTVTFSGTLHGNGYTIHNLSHPLVTEVTEDGVIKNLDINFTLKNDSFVASICRKNNGHLYGITLNFTIGTSVSQDGELKGEQSGGIAAENSGVIENCSIEEKSSLISSHHFVGGISGINTGTINNCSVINSGITGVSTTGGISGRNKGEIIKSSLESSSVKGGKANGGIVGYNKALVKSCDTNRSKIEDGKNICGGIVAVNIGDITECSFRNGSIFGLDTPDCAGGICGKLKRRGTITKSNASGDLKGKKYIGGICGEVMNGIIRDCYCDVFVDKRKGRSRDITKTHDVGLAFGNISGGKTTVENSYILNMQSNLPSIGNRTPRKDEFEIHRNTDLSEEELKLIMM